MYLTKARLEKVEIAKKSHPPRLVELTAGDSQYLGIVYPNPESIPEELARLLGGVEITEAVTENAREMKKMADQTKERVRSQHG